MAANSAIEWTDATWNPIRARNLKTGKVGWHCEHATTGCEFCYAEGFNKRLGTGLAFKPGHRKDIEIFLDEEMLLQPLRWKKPRMIFVCSMTDLFADFVPDESIDKMFAVMALCPQHTFQVLTKRAARMREYLQGDVWGRIYKAAVALAPHPERYAYADLSYLLAGWGTEPRAIPNVWLGVSTERQQEADERIPLLLQTPAAVRFISAEPLLGPISLRWAKWDDWTDGKGKQRATVDHLDGARRLDWIIVGGESGRGARPMHPDWARKLRDECAEAAIPLFFKQWGEWKDGSDFAPDAMCITTDGRVTEPTPDAMYAADREAPVMRLQPTLMRRVGKKAAGRLLDGVEHNGMPVPRT